MTMFYGAATSITIFVFISSTTISTYAKIEQISASETGDNLAQQNAVVADESASETRPHIGSAGLSADNLAEPDEHHRIVILVPQLVSPAAAAAAYSQRAKKPKKKKPVAPGPPKKKPKVHHHHHPNVVPVVHSGKVIHAHHHHGSVDHGHSHVGKAKHTHKHFGNAHHKHGHYGVGRITHKHVATVKPPPPPPPHKPKHPHHLTAAAGGVDVFGQNFYSAQQPHQQRLRQQNPYQNQYFNHPQPQPQQQSQSQLPPSHLQHQQQVLHHRAFAPSSAPNHFGNPIAASDPYSSSFYGGGGGGVGFGGLPAAPAAFGNRRRTANDRRDLFPPNGNVAQLIQIRRIPSKDDDGDVAVDSFIDKNTRSSLAAAALAFGNENENENQVDVDGGEADAENENENENETENEAENENDNENETEKDDETSPYVGGGGGGVLERAIEEAAFAAIPHRKSGRTRRPFDATNAAAVAVPSASDSQENLAALRLNGIDQGGGFSVHQNEASLHYPTFVNPPLPGLAPNNKIIAFSDAYHYQY